MGHRPPRVIVLPPPSPQHRIERDLALAKQVYVDGVWSLEEFEQAVDAIFAGALFANLDPTSQFPRPTMTGLRR